MAIHNPKSVHKGVKNLLLDGTCIDGKKIPALQDGKEHKVEVEPG
jgi:hypothetical protein